MLSKRLIIVVAKTRSKLNKSRYIFGNIIAGVGTYRAVRGPLAFASRITEFYRLTPKTARIDYTLGSKLQNEVGFSSTSPRSG